MDPIPPTKKPFSDHKDFFPPKDLHHHHLSPDFSSFNNPPFHPPPYGHSSAAQYDSSSPNYPYFDNNRWYPSESRSQNFGYEGSRFERRPPLQQPFAHEYQPPFFASDDVNQPYNYGYEPGPNYGYQTGPYYSTDYQSAHLTDNYLRRVPIEEPPMRRSIKGEGFLEYVPFEKKYIEQVPVEKIEYVPMEKSYMDYYAVEKQIEYVPKLRYESKVEYVPQQIVDHIPQTYVDYVPVKKKEFVPVERLQEVVDYQPIDRSIIHYPQVEKQFIEEAEKSGRIRMDLAGAYVPPQIATGTAQSQFHYGKKKFGPNFSQSHAGKKNLDQSTFVGNNNANFYQNNASYLMDNNNMPYNYNYNYNQNVYPGNQIGQTPGYYPETPGVYPGAPGYYLGAPAYYPGAPAYYPGAQAYYTGAAGYYPGAAGNNPETNGYNNQGFNGGNQNEQTPAYARNPKGKFNETKWSGGRNGYKSDLESLKKKLEEGKKYK